MFILLGGIKVKSIKVKLLSAFILLAVIVSLYSVYNYTVNKNIITKSETMIEQNLAILMASEKLANSMNIRMIAVKNYLMTGEKKHLKNFEEQVLIAEDSSTTLQQLVPQPQQEELAKLTVKGQEWGSFVQQQVFQTYDKGEQQAALLKAKQIETQGEMLRKAYRQLAEERGEEMKVAGAQLIQDSQKTQFFGIMVAISIVIIALIVGIITARKITTPIRDVVQTMDDLAQGNLRQTRVQIKSKDELATLVQATNKLSENLHNTITVIQDVSQQVAGNSHALAQSFTSIKEATAHSAGTMGELAQGADEQTSHAVHLIHAMTDFSEKITEAEQEGQQLNRQSQKVNELTSHGQHTMSSTIHQMQEIDHIVQQAVHKVESLNEQSTEITTLVTVISTVAEQTNLLALNAAIEAARAGEHGKGFAVVADEVRKLAEQVAQSVTSISSIVTRIQQETAAVTTSLQQGYEEVQKGTSQMTATEHAFIAITDEVAHMASSITIISQNLVDVVTDTKAMTSAVNQVSAITQQSASGVEETTATMQEIASTMEEAATNTDQLAQQAEALKRQVKQFTI